MFGQGKGYGQSRGVSWWGLLTCCLWELPGLDPLWRPNVPVDGDTANRGKEHASWDGMDCILASV